MYGENIGGGGTMNGENIGDGGGAINGKPAAAPFAIFGIFGKIGIPGGIFKNLAIKLASARKKK